MVRSGKCAVLATIVSTLAVAAVLLAAGTAGAQRVPSLIADEVLAEKCSLCHEGHRVYTMDPGTAKEVVKRMQSKNPDWITEAESDHIIQAIASIAKDPSVIATRKAWVEAVEKGKGLFENTSLGTNGKSCASCHSEENLRNSAASFPKYDMKSKRIIGLAEAINGMITTKMDGKALTVFGVEILNLESYLKSLR